MPEAGPALARNEPGCRTAGSTATLTVVPGPVAAEADGPAGVGHARAKTLRSMNVRTAGELRVLPVETLERLFLLKRELGSLGVGISRIASGVPHGGDLEFADPITMGRALAGRQRL